MAKKILYLALLFAFIGCGNKKETKQAAKDEKINGVWIAAPEHNTLMHSHKNLVNGVAELNELGINHLFICMWADNKTAYDSKVLLENSSYSNIEETNLFSEFNYKSETNDPVKDLISEAHKYNMKVIFWFEYGFMAKWGEAPTPENNPILAKHPNWIGIGNDGKACNYNNTDFYFNSYLPEVHQFILDLVAESLARYPEIDGVQGDDRLPAAPANSGYDEYTVNRFKKEHDGNEPPTDFYEEHWVKWRLQILNGFGVRFHNLVKATNPDYIVAFSPNPYPWCLEKLMQDWPGWIDSSIVDMLSVQCYRKHANAYQKTVDEALSHITPRTSKEIFAPGIILGIGSGKIMEPASLDSILNYNTQLGIGGQSYFYAKWLLESDSFNKVVKKHAK